MRPKPLVDLARDTKRRRAQKGPKRPLVSNMKDVEPVIAKVRAERRRFKRVRVDLPGRLFVPSEQHEARCTVVNLSPGGAAIECELEPVSDTQVVLYIDGFGRFEGSVIRREGGDFGVRFNCTPLKRERIAEQLMLFLNKTLVDSTVIRRHERAPTKGYTRFTRADGQLVKCEVLDISTSGVSVKTDVRPPVGEYVLIGQMAGRIARHHESGVGIEFVGAPAPTQPEKLNQKLSVIR